MSSISHLRYHGRYFEGSEGVSISKPSEMAVRGRDQPALAPTLQDPFASARTLISADRGNSRTRRDTWVNLKDSRLPGGAAPAVWLSLPVWVLPITQASRHPLGVRSGTKTQDAPSNLARGEAPAA